MTGIVRLLEATLTMPKAGDFVSWPASKGVAKGKVVSIHTASKVPAVATKVIGSKDRPAARVQLYAKTNGGWEPTTTHVAQPVDALTAIDELLAPSTTEAVVAGSFDDLREQVQAAIEDRAEALTGVDGYSAWIVDMGLGWAVYCVNWGDDLFLIGWSLDGDVVVLGDPIEVTKVTTYVPETEPVDGPTGEVLTEAVDRIEGRLLGALGVDANGGRIFGVRIIAYGDSKNGRRYPESVMRTAAPMYEGAKAYDHHRTDAELATSTVTGLVGHYENVVATAEGLEAELHLLPGATHVAEAFDVSLANQSRGLPPLIGISHDVMAAYRPLIVSGRKITEATQIVSVNSADVVADPAAGGKATRMVAGGPGGVPTQTPSNTVPERTNSCSGPQSRRSVPSCSRSMPRSSKRPVSPAPTRSAWPKPASTPLGPSRRPCSADRRWPPCWPAPRSSRPVSIPASSSRSFSSSASSSPKPSSPRR